MSDQPTGFFPQPIASAMGFQIAMTTGERTRFCVSPIKSCPVLTLDSALPNLMKADEAGEVISAWRLPLISSSMQSPDPSGMAVT
jgi:hypothetical protein